MRRISRNLSVFSLSLSVVLVLTNGLAAQTGQTPKQQKIAALKAEIRKSEESLKRLRRELEQAYESSDGPEAVPPPPSPGQPVTDDVAGFHTVFQKSSTGWTQRPTAQGFTFRTDGKRLLTSAVEGGDLVYVPGRVKDGADVLGPGWFPAQYAKGATLASPDPKSKLMGGDLSQPFVDDPAGWFTIYVYQGGGYLRRKVAHAPDVVVSNGYILTTAKEGQMNYLPYRISLNGKLLPPGWYKPADPGDVVTGK